MIVPFPGAERPDHGPEAELVEALDHFLENCARDITPKHTLWRAMEALRVERALYEIRRAENLK